MTAIQKSSFGVIGLGVMGRNLALNIEEHGFPSAVWNLEPEATERFLSESAGRAFTGAWTLEELVAAVERPRRILLMITAGDPVDATLERLAPHLEGGDIVVDGGNSRYQDTRRREAWSRERGFSFVGMGVSGGEEGARHGPSLMPGGAPEAYERLRPVLEAVAARSDAGPCVTHVGPDGAGHFIKMVHNGIEYGDMQLLAEAYDLLRRGAGKDAPELAEEFDRWNQGPLASFLVEITARILRVRDEKTGAPLVDMVLDRAGQKGTGKWTVESALDLGVEVPTLAAAVDARVLSSRKEERERASRALAGPSDTGEVELGPAFADRVRDALLAGRICALAQGMNLIRAASREFRWGIDRSEVARIWKAGCIIRSRLLDDLRRAFATDADLENLILDPDLAALLQDLQPAWRAAAAAAIRLGIPAPALQSSLAWFDATRTARLPQNLTQAQRDAFGAHTYRRTDDPTTGPIHTDWLG